MMGMLDDRVAIVTAAGGGIAGAIARRFAAEGASVCCVDINKETVNQTVTDIKEQVREQMVPLHPIGRLGKPEDIANTAVFFASEQSSFMTGSDVFVDGEFTAI